MDDERCIPKHIPTIATRKRVGVISKLKQSFKPAPPTRRGATAVTRTANTCQGFQSFVLQIVYLPVWDRKAAAAVTASSQSAD